MPRVYATVEQAWPADPPANADLVLRLASRVVDHLLVGRVYDVDTDSMPTDPDVAQALQDATVTIAHEVVERGSLEAGGTAEWQAVSIGSVSLSGRMESDGTVMVSGIPVPPVALIYLGDVGTRWVRS